MPIPQPMSGVESPWAAMLAGNAQPQQSVAPQQTQLPPEVNHLMDVLKQYTQNQQQQNTGGLTQQILSQRFQPTMEDTARSVFQSNQNSQYYSPEQAANQRATLELAPYTAMAELQNKSSSNLVANAGGATGVLINRYMQEHPGGSFSDALTAVQAGPALTRQGLQLGPGNTIAPIAGVPEAKGSLKFGEQSGEQRANLQYAAPIAAAKSGAEESTKAQYAAPIERQKKLGAQQGEAAANLQTDIATLPQLEDTVRQLNELGKSATYTRTGLFMNEARRQLGLDMPQGAIDRAAYISMVDNQILPLLRRTFGAQFTEREGATLRATLGDPNKAPAEKEAILKSFIDQKKATIGTLQRETGQVPSNPPGGPTPTPGGAAATHRYNPATGQLELVQ